MKQYYMVLSSVCVIANKQNYQTTLTVHYVLKYFVFAFT